MFAAAYLRRLLATTCGPIEVVARPARGSELTPGDVGRALPEDPLLTLVRRSDPRRRGTRTVLLSMGGAADLGEYLRLLGRERRRAWVVVGETDIAAARPPGRTPRGGLRALAARAGASAGSARDAVLADQRWALASRDKRAEHGWRLDDDVEAEFLRVVRRSGTPRRTAVFLARPWPADAAAQSALPGRLDAMARACADAGLVFQIRPASKTDSARYQGRTVLDPTGPAELDPHVVDAGLVLAEPCVELLHLAAVHGVPAVRIDVDPDHQKPIRRPDRSDPLAAFVPLRASAGDLGPLLSRVLR